MISYAGIAIFIFGNKLGNGNVIESNGMREEFIIAKGKGLFLLPIGVTGYISKQFYDEINSNFDEFYPEIDKDTRAKFAELNDANKSPDEIIKIYLIIFTEVIKCLEKQEVIVQ